MAVERSARPDCSCAGITMQFYGRKVRVLSNKVAAVALRG
jgi:hypothetical protein